MDFEPLLHSSLTRLSRCHHIPWSVALLNRRLATLMASSHSHGSVPTLCLRHVAVIVLQQAAISSRFAACCNKQASCAEHGDCVTLDGMLGTASWHFVVRRAAACPVSCVSGDCITCRSPSRLLDINRHAWHAHSAHSCRWSQACISLGAAWSYVMTLQY